MGILKYTTLSIMPLMMGSHFTGYIVHVSLIGNTRVFRGAMAKRQKNNIIKELAEKYFQEGKITRKVYDALMKYEVEITD